MEPLFVAHQAICVWPVRSSPCTMLVLLQRNVPAAGLCTADVNGSDMVQAATFKQFRSRM